VTKAGTMCGKVGQFVTSWDSVGLHTQKGGIMNDKGGIRWDKSWDKVWKVFIYSHKRSNKVGQGTTVLFGEILFDTDTYYYYYYYYFIETISMCDKR